MSSSRYHRLLPFLASAALLVAALASAWGGPLFALRWGLLFGAAAAATLAPAAAVSWCLLAVPLLPIVSRVLLGQVNLSLAEHLVVGLLPPLLWRAARDASPGPRSAVDAGQALFVAVVLVSLATVVREYGAVGVGVAEFVGVPLRWSFDPTLGAFAVDRFVVLRHALVFVEGGLWWLALSRSGAALRASDLRRALIAGLLASAVVGAAQAFWHFAPVAAPTRTEQALFRISATFPDNNTFAVYVALLAPLTLAAAWTGPRRVARILAVASLLGFTLLAAASRSAWVAVFACGLVAAFAVARRPQRVGVSASPRMQRGLTAAALASVVALVSVVGIGTALDLGRDLSYPHLTNLGEVALMSVNLRRPANEILADRFLYWQRAIALWRQSPWFGIGVGRYALWKVSPPTGVVVSSLAPSPTTISVGPAPNFDRWVNAGAGLNFQSSDVLGGDTIESPGGGWGPILVQGRWSPTQLTLATPARPGPNLDFVIRHPRFDPSLRAHAHRSVLPFWTGAHNSYLQLLSELGLVGLAAFALLLGGIGVEIARGLRLPAPQQRLRAAAAGLGILALLIDSLAQDPLTVKEMQYVFWALVAVVALENRGGEIERSPRR